MMDENALEKLITKIVIETLEKEEKVKNTTIHVGVSARHVHLTREHVEALFGKGYELKKKKELMGGQFASEEFITIIGTKLRAIENVRILGPERKKSQVEISRTDAFKLGINPPIRDSGDLKGSAPIALVGPAGAVYLDDGCIIAKRHIHMSLLDAENYGVSDGQEIKISFSEGRGGVFEGVVVRVDPTFTLEMHIDTDEANGLGIVTGDKGEIVQ